MINSRPDIKDLLRGAIISVVFLLLSFQSLSFFESIEKFLYGIEMRFALAPPVGAGKISMVNIDKKSINRLGPWPWPRSVIAEMIDKLGKNGAKLIALDLDGLDRKEPNQGLMEIEKLNDRITAMELPAEKRGQLKDMLSDIETKLDNDNALAAAIKNSGNVILPAKGFNSETDPVMNEVYTSGIEKMKILNPHPDSDSLYKFNNILLPFPELAQNCTGIGHNNLSPENTMSGRGHLLFFNLKSNFEDNIIPSMPLRIALEYMGGETFSMAFPDGEVMLDGRTIPAQKGELLIRFLGGRRSFPYYSFADIYNEDHIPFQLFDGKIVLIGYTADAGVKINTPVDQAMPRIEFIANVVQSLIGHSYIKRPGAMTYIEAFILIILVMCFSFVLPRNSHINRICIIISLCIIIVIVGAISFVVMDVWIKTIYILAAVVVLYFELLVENIVASQKMMGIRSEEFMESNRMLGLSFQSQGLLDLAFEKFRKCNLDNSMKDVIYNLGLDYERKRMLNKAISVYEYIAENDIDFRDLEGRIAMLRQAIGATAISPKNRKKDEKILVVNDLEIKPTVGRYEIVREIGQGAMGVVYEAKDPKINRPIAIKTIRFSDEFEEERVKEVKNRFFKEAEIAGKLSHPSIVSIYDAGEDYDLTYLAMEYLDGKDLRNYSKKDTLKPLKTVLQIISDVALALDHAHQRGVIHRDIKPGNIMLLKNGKVKVTDFGIAKAMSSTQTKSGVVLGTPSYMSPEQINGQYIDGRSDIFSLGVVLFEMLSGQVPFHGKNITNLLYQIAQGKHPSIRDINPKIPKVCEQIINKALEKKPEDRFQTGTEMAKYLTATLKRIDEAGKPKSENE